MARTAKRSAVVTVDHPAAILAAYQADAAAHADIASLKLATFRRFTLAIGGAVAGFTESGSLADLLRALTERNGGSLPEGCSQGALSRAALVWTHLTGSHLRDAVDADTLYHARSGGTPQRVAYAAAHAVGRGELKRADVIEAIRADTVPPMPGRDAKGNGARGPEGTGAPRAVTADGADPGIAPLATATGATYGDAVATAGRILAMVRDAARIAKAPHATLADLETFARDALAKAAAPAPRSRRPKADAPAQA